MSSTTATRKAAICSPPIDGFTSVDKKNNNEDKRTSIEHVGGLPLQVDFLYSLLVIEAKQTSLRFGLFVRTYWQVAKKEQFENKLLPNSAADRTTHSRRVRRATFCPSTDVHLQYSFPAAYLCLP